MGIKIKYIILLSCCLLGRCKRSRGTMSSVLSSVLATDERLLHSYECGPNDTNPMFRVKHLVTGSEYVKMLCQCNPPLYAVLATEDAEWLRVLPVRPKWLFHPKKREVIGNVPGTNYRLHTIIAYRMYTEANGLSYRNSLHLVRPFVPIFWRRAVPFVCLMACLMAAPGLFLLSIRPIIGRQGACVCIGGVGL